MLQRYLQEVNRLLVGIAVALGALYLMQFFLIETRTIWSYLAIVSSLILGIGLTLIALSPDIASLYGVSEKTAIGLMFRTMLGSSNGIHVIEDGRTTVPSDVEEVSIPGPRSVHIRCSAAVFYQGSHLTRVSGPCSVDTDAWEYARHIFDLRRCQETLTYDHVLTAEHIPMRIELSVIYGIAVSPETIRGEEQMTPSEESMILRICTEIPDWKKVVQEDIAQSLRKAAANYYFNDLLRPASIDALSHQVRTRSRRRLHPYGIRVRRVSVLSIRPADELLQAASQAQIDLARTHAQRDTLRVIAEGYISARSMRMSSANTHREILRQIVKSLAHEPYVAGYPLTTEMTRSLLALRRHLGL